MFTIPFVIFNDLTLTKSKDKYVEEFRCLPSEFCPSYDDKGTTVATKPICLSDPIEIKADLKIYLKVSIFFIIFFSRYCFPGKLESANVNYS